MISYKTTSISVSIVISEKVKLPQYKQASNQVANCQDTGQYFSIAMNISQ